MDLTHGTQEEKNNRAKKMMLWFGIISLIMSFAGWTSAYVVSSSREDWLNDFLMPNSFIISTVIIILSSLTLVLAKTALKNANHGVASIGLLATFVLGIVFVFFQFSGFQQIIDLGYNFTGPTSNVTVSYIFLIAIVHILHIVVGLFCLMVVIYNHFRQKYKPNKMLGFELVTTFWHFIDVLWVYLFLFLYFNR